MLIVLLSLLLNAISQPIYWRHRDEIIPKNWIQSQHTDQWNNHLINRKASRHLLAETFLWKDGNQALYRSGDLILINNYTVGLQRYPIIAPLKTGGFIVFFMGKDRSSSNERYYAQQFAADYSKVGPEMQISAYAFDANSIPRAAVFSDNGYVVVGQTSLFPAQNGLDIFVEVSTTNGLSTYSTFLANNYTFDVQLQPDVVAFSDDRFLVTWTSNEPSPFNFEIKACFFDRNTTRIGGEFLANSNTAFWQNNPRVVAFRDDDFVIVWNSIGQDGSGLGIFFQRFYANGTKQSSEMQANNYTNGDQYGATLGAFSDKGMIIAWEGNGQDQRTGNITDSVGIYAQLFDQYNNREGSEFRVNTYTDGTQTEPAVTILPNNQFLITWVSYYQVSPSYASTHAQLFMRNGTRVGEEFQVSSVINGFQLDPHAAALDNENIFCVFASTGEDGDNYGIVGQALLLGTSSPTTTPTQNPSVPPTALPSLSPTGVTIIPTATPSLSPTASPSLFPSLNPSLRPTTNTNTPTATPSLSPTVSPSLFPSLSPSLNPTSNTNTPTATPSLSPTASPSLFPSLNPSLRPTTNTNTPTATPSLSPTVSPSLFPSLSPSLNPTSNTNTPTATPSLSPSISPSLFPSLSPSLNPTSNTNTPTATPSLSPTVSPSTSPSIAPSVHPTQNPSYLPTASPSYSPTHIPTSDPTYLPSIHPTLLPSLFPSQLPTKSPTMLPTLLPITSLQPTVGGANNQSNKWQPATYIASIVPLSLLGILITAAATAYVCRKRNDSVQADIVHGVEFTLGDLDE